MDTRARPVTGPDPQLSFGELGTPLAAVTFVVIDLETTGGPPDSDAITEIGAVKVRGRRDPRRVRDPGRPRGRGPPQIVSLTGITTAMVRDAPRLAAVLPSLLEFCAGAVVVAHNAPFDVGHLRAACRRHGPSWPRPAVVCTARLGRRALTRDEAPSCRLSALAQIFRATTTPNHRALADARATVDVLHGLLERVGARGVSTLEDLLRAAGRGRPRPSGPSATSPTPCRTRPGSTCSAGRATRCSTSAPAATCTAASARTSAAGDKRARMKEMVGLAERVDWVVCAHALEAEVRELRLLAGHAPRYNRRSRYPHRGWWVALTDEPFPRLSVVRTPRADALGPFGRRPDAVRAVETLLDAVPLRPCTQRIPARGAAGTPCALHEMRRCAAPCAGRIDVETYRPVVEDARALVRGRRRRGPAGALRRRWPSSPQVSASRTPPPTATGWPTSPPPSGRVQRLSAVAGTPEMIAARPDGERRLGVRRRPPRPPRRRGAGPARGAADAGGRRAGGDGRDRAARPRTAVRRPARGGRRRHPLARAPGHPDGAHDDAVDHARGRGGGAAGRRDGVAPVARAGGARDGPLHSAADRARHRRETAVITAIVLVHADADRIPETAQAIADLEGVAEVYSCAGDVDLVAMVRVREHEQLADVIAGHLSRVPGVRATSTHIAFRSYSSRDDASAFSVGSTDRGRRLDP